MARKYDNNGRGLEMAILQSHPWTLVSSTGRKTWYKVEHPVPVLSRRAYQQSGIVIDSTVGFCYNVFHEKGLGQMEFLFVYQGDFYEPGVVVEDSLTMPCIWVE